MKFIGIKPADHKSKGNIGTIWERGEDGKYRSKQKLDIVLERWQITSDIRNGYLKAEN